MGSSKVMNLNVFKFELNLISVPYHNFFHIVVGSGWREVKTLIQFNFNYECCHKAEFMT